MAKSSSDLEKLQGIWDIVKLEIDGSAVATNGSRIVIDGEKFTSLAMGATYAGTIAVRASQKPKAFNLHFTDGPEKGNTSLGIYELEGDDWKICLTVTGKKRPGAFATKPGSGLALETLRRSGAAAQAIATADASGAGVHFDPVAELQGEWSLVSLDLNGVPIDPNGVPYGKRTVKGDELTVSFGKEVVTRARMNADPKASPKIMDYVHVSGLNAGKLQRGIYELHGKTLKICSAPPGEARPADFSATPQNRRTLAVWKLAGK